MKKFIRIFLLILIIIGVILLATQKMWVPKLVDYILSHDTPVKSVAPAKKAVTATPITVKTQNIKEENFTGSKPIISGSGLVVTKAKAYVDQTISEFRKDANTDVPDMRKQFGADNPTANYEIDVDAKYLKGSKADSIVLNIYTYTGGAHGNTSYKVFTSDAKGTKILALSDIIKKEEESAFTEFVKKQLDDWRPSGSEGQVVFPDSVKDLTFDSFANFSLDDKNLTIYFDQGDIGPEVLGPVAFPLTLDKIKNFLN